MEQVKCMEERIQRCHEILDHHPYAVYALDAEGRFISANQAFVRLSGYERAEILGSSWKNKVALHHHDQVYESMIQIKQGESMQLQLEMVRKDGELIEWQVTHVPILDQGEYVGIYGIASDLTERRQAERELWLTREKLESFFSHTGDSIVILDTDRNVIGVNAAFERLFGYTNEELKGKELPIIPEEFQEDMNAIYVDVFAGKEVPAFETVRLSRDGAELIISLTISPIRDQGGSVSAIASIARDITRKKALEQELRFNAEKYRTIMDNMFDLICIVERTGYLSYASPSHERILGLPYKEYEGRNVASFTHPDDLERLAGELKILYTEKTPVQSEIRLFRATDEVWITAEARCMPLFDKRGEVDRIIVVSRDVTENRRAAKLLEESEQRYKCLFEYNSNAVFSLDLEGNFTSMNPAAVQITGYEMSELVRSNFRDMLLLSEKEKAFYHFRRGKMGEPQNFDLTFLHKQGHPIELQVTTTPIFVHGEFVGIYGIAKDVTEQKRAEALFNYLAYHDELTGLPNRRLFTERLMEMLDHAKQHKEKLGVLFIDLDRFKLINDSLGHAFGDQLLQAVAERLESCLPVGAMVARMGGDEFTLLIPNVDVQEKVTQVAHSIIDSLSHPFFFGGQEFHTTPSIGIAVYPEDGEDTESLMKHADAAMYRAKDQGRNNYQLYSSILDNHTLPRLELENALRKAIERDEFVLHYQPIVDSAGEIRGIEALIRWNHPEKGMVAPGQFIPVAEESGLIVPMGQWVMRTACRQNKAWQDAGLPKVRVAVNLSTYQFQQKNLVDQVAGVLEETGLSPQYLELEITESIAAHNVEDVQAKLRALKEMGLHISIDDFGTGYSSLSYLKKFPIHSLKIDRSFVGDLTTDNDDATIVEAIIVMAHSLKLGVIAEGVECQEQLDFLRELKCDEMQGYFFGKPMSAEEVAGMLGACCRQIG
ncbi:bifunctional diguanylate cyclase/phosphodiesterase [Brevibacillus dissolubilis]|uniref:bifunctional diguanylate cyclase/phosphodiesterase n=1 Tax=Brevibacillus dissolubilis TaxID=1844116 RepID=UPI00111750DB|nr:bifunctional diguanylate cyclase/phosphodiesterase [Brevibacillus dissolubilis]